jgi:hypothetical protein
MFDKWKEKKPKEKGQLFWESALETAESVKEVTDKWTALDAKISKLRADAKQFGKKFPKLEYYDALEQDLGEVTKSWDLFQKFKAELDEMNKEEWMSYKNKRYFAFQDFFL